jgi:hypothetical protein
MVVEEVLQGIPKDAGEVEVETSAMTSCYMRLAKDERYLIFASRDPHNPELLHNHVCAHSFNIRGSDRLLQALRDAEARGTTHLLGSVYKQREQYGLGDIAGGGIRVTAVKGDRNLETLTTAHGQFDFEGVMPGTWAVRVDSPGLVHHDIWPAGDPVVPQHGCAVRYLSAASNGKIRGKVRGADGEPVAGVPVEAFAFDKRGQLETLRFREAVTKADGSYEIDALPAQDYVVGINGEKYHDRLAYSPLFYSQSRIRDSATRITIGEMQVRDRVDFILGKVGKKPFWLSRLVSRMANQPQAWARISRTLTAFSGPSPSQNPETTVCFASRCGSAKHTRSRPGRLIFTLRQKTKRRFRSRTGRARLAQCI